MRGAFDLIMPHLSIRIDFEPSGSALGPGMAQLLERVAETGSIRRAAASMDMSYRKAWLLIQELQKTFDGAVPPPETPPASAVTTAPSKVFCNSWISSQALR